MNLHRIVYQDRAGKNSVRWAVSVGERDELIRQIAKGKGRVLLEGLVEIPKGRPAMARFLNMFAGNIVFSIEEGKENDEVEPRRDSEAEGNQTTRRVVGHDQGNRAHGLIPRRFRPG